jgi:SAM-dependent methyltransferase
MTGVTEIAGDTPVYVDGAAWTAGPQVVYDRLAASALDRLPADLRGTSALDVGAGTGAATRALLRRGAAVTAADNSPSMLAELTRQTDGTVPVILADIRKLPLADGMFDATVAAYVINHLDEPAAAVTELARVTRRGGTVLATTFSVDDHPIKATVDEVLVRHGFVHPAWYVDLKKHRMPLIGTPPALHSLGVVAGLDDVAVDSVDVDLSDVPWETAAAYRLGLGHIVPFLRGLDPTERADVEAEVLAAIEVLPPFRLPMLVLFGRAGSGH